MLSFFYGLLLLAIGGALGGLICYWLARQGKRVIYRRRHGPGAK